MGWGGSREAATRASAERRQGDERAALGVSASPAAAPRACPELITAQRPLKLLARAPPGESHLAGVRAERALGRGDGRRLSFCERLAGQARHMASPPQHSTARPAQCSFPLGSCSVCGFKQHGMPHKLELAAALGYPAGGSCRPRSWLLTNAVCALQHSHIRAQRSLQTSEGQGRRAQLGMGALAGASPARERQHTGQRFGNKQSGQCIRVELGRCWVRGMRLLGGACVCAARREGKRPRGLYNAARWYNAAGWAPLAFASLGTAGAALSWSVSRSPPGSSRPPAPPSGTPSAKPRGWPPSGPPAKQAGRRHRGAVTGARHGHRTEDRAGIWHAWGLRSSGCQHRTCGGAPRPAAATWLPDCHLHAALCPSGHKPRPPTPAQPFSKHQSKSSPPGCALPSYPDQSCPAAAPPSHRRSASCVSSLVSGGGERARGRVGVGAGWWAAHARGAQAGRQRERGCMRQRGSRAGAAACGVQGPGSP